MRADQHTGPGSAGSESTSRWQSLLRLGLLGAGLLFLTSQMTCAEVASYWNDDNRPPMTGDGGDVDGGDGMWRCFMGTPSKEEELLNRCTEAERIDRPSAIPTATWDGKSPLPFQ
jgi:hypothetical protein